MQFIKELINVIDSYRSKHIEIIGNETKQQTKLSAFYDGVKTGKINNDQDALLTMFRQFIPENEEIYVKVAEENGFTRRDISDEEIVDRCILGLVNEGAKILEEGVAQRSSDMDIVYINGYGFPIWRGGPMFYANSIGLDKVLSLLFLL